MDFQEVREAFDTGSIMLSDGTLSVFYAMVGDQWASQSFSDTNPDDSPSISKRVFESLLRNSDVFSMNFFAGGKMRLDFTVRQSDAGGNVKYCWFLPLTQTLSRQELEEKLAEWIQQSPERMNAAAEQFADAIDFFSQFNLRNPSEAEFAVMEWNAITADFDDNLPDEDHSNRWDEMLSTARALYKSVVLGAMGITPPSLGGGFGMVEFQLDTKDKLVFHITGHTKDLLAHLVHVADVVSFEAGNNGGLKTYINIGFYS